MEVSHRRFDPALWSEQARAILLAWGVEPSQAATIAETLTAADLMGIDSHGLNLFPLYEQLGTIGVVKHPAEITVIRDHAAVALIDGGSGLGHPPTMLAVEMAAERAAKFGVSVISIRNSQHYGAAGIYVRRLAEQGLIGISTTSVWRGAIVPTGGREAMLGTNPLAFAAPVAGKRPFLLDMATSTAAIGKLRLADQAGKEMPADWALTPEGTPERDPARALLAPLLTPLGGHKGYGLAVMMEILASTLSGATATPLRRGENPPRDVGQMVMALDPALIGGDLAAFKSDLARMAESLRATAPVNAEKPVMVAGDPEYAMEDERRARGIPLPPALEQQIREIAARARAAFLLEEAEAMN